tara:strand:- start:623 stop:3187 length:2565 start_codon:yes stop_codon:yes gene_type:complete
MDTSSYEDQLANFSDLFKKSALPILIVSALITVGLGMHLITSPPEFRTDLNDFAPSSDSKDAHDRIHEYFPDESRPLFIHVTRSNDGNVLSIDSLKDMQSDLETLQTDERVNLVAVDSWTTSPGMIQIALDEQSPNTTLTDYDTWPQLVDAIVDDDTKCELNPDDALLSTVNFVGSALVNKNLDIAPTCNYLSSGDGDAVPTAASTAWVLEINPEMAEDERREVQNDIRTVLSEISSSSNMTYSCASLDLMSYDIDKGTFDNLAQLIIFATLVVVLLLFVAFRNVKGVLFPFLSLNVALVWTYGTMNLFGLKFTALEVAVAPLVLGLGIDYAIHLQRALSDIREKVEDTAEAWMRACGKLSVPLTLAVVTTVAAFLANIISPLPPLATFGIALAFGVICAFLSSTLLIGALHVVFDNGKQSKSMSPLRLTNLTKPLLQLHKKQQVAVLLVAIAISGASVVGAMQLETDFDLSDFVNEEMEIMSVRDDINENYDSAGWKYVYVLMEPVDGGVIPDDGILLDQLRNLHSKLESNHDVVGTDERFPSPSYEGPYIVLRDAIMRNESFGNTTLEIFAGDVYEKNGESVDLGSLFSELQSNYTIADPVSGKTWSDRVNATVNLDGTNIAHLRNEVRVEATTSDESKRVVSEFESMFGSTSDEGQLRESLKDHAVIHVTGDLVVLQQVLEGLSSSQVKSTAISLVVSFVVLLLLTRRVLPALIVLLPVGMASLWVVGSMAVLGLKWNVLTVLVTALTLGIGIDYTIHMWRRIEWELKRHDDHWAALKTSLESTGVALMLSAATTAAGFIVLLLSPMPVIQDFGLITAVTVFFSLVLALVLLPVLLELAARSQEAAEESNS